MELYVHIPFCVKKCNYCDFLSFPGYGCDADERHRSLSCRYVDALCGELERVGRKLKNTPAAGCRSESEEAFTSCFIGGGTPSVLDKEQTEKLLIIISRLLNMLSAPEFTIECNPGTVTKEKLLLYRKYGVNRLSFGLQSTENEILKRLGRIHTYEEFLESFRLARECGFDNINIDLISAVPGQTIDNWKDTLKKVAALGAEHISAYSLILEEGTLLYSEYEKDPASLNLPDEETEREIYHITQRILNENGYEKYEISNYARPGYECRHNIGYWTGEEYIGVGLGAASYISDRNYQLLYKNMPQKEIMVSGTDMLRLKNTEDIGKYIGYYSDKKNFDNCKDAGENSEIGIAAVEERLDLNAQMSEFCILGLRMCIGISKSEFAKRFGKDIYDRFGEVIRKHILSGLLEEDDDRIRCTPKGLDLNNSVLCDLLL